MTNADIRTGQPVNFGLPSHEELARIEESILVEPSILLSGLDTIISRYTYAKTEDGAYLTPDTTIEIEQNDDPQQTTVFAGWTENNYRRRVIFQRDPSSGLAAEWIVLTSASDVSVSDGSGRSLDSEADRKYVRSVLEAMKTSYDRNVTEKTDGFDIKQHLLETLDETIATKKAELASLEHQREQAEQNEGVFDKFKVTIHSGWEREGEQTVEEEVSAARLSEVLLKATEKFKQLNRRSDVQARAFSVAVSVGDGQFWTIPNEVVSPLFQSLSQWDKEASDIERAKQGLANSQS